ncbi:hypothetical protein UFOVP760_99 [uncultured Caudovirales phage]|uniref:Uncharacterized protein n=1 Tax=uncultured Caudovirales phage TaxID=2100421 RepID=A0A6J7X668_9CAUD|nr:hypothetical protein UFOVP760_99 [uncultured Caudovirales phage]
MTPEKFEARNHKLRCDFADMENYKKSFRCKFNNFLEDKFGTRKLWQLIPFVPRWADIYYYEKVRPIFSPQNKRYRKIIPRTWSDVSNLIEVVNFEFIKGFYEDEYLHGHTDWEGTGERAVEFAKWLESAYDYITIERPMLEKQMDDAYPILPPLKEMFVPCEYDDKGKVKMLKMVDDGRTYEEKYGEVNRLEQLIQDKDTEILTQVVKYRFFFWS